MRQLLKDDWEIKIKIDEMLCERLILDSWMIEIEK